VALLGGVPGGHLVFAQPRGAAADMGALAKEIFKDFGGKGGGAKDFAQGALADGERVEAAIDSAKAKMSAETQKQR
jgi:alanyl-tRNA synthetase